MTPISSFELLVLERGIGQVCQEGHQEENRKKGQQAVLDVLKTRFGQLSILVRDSVQALNEAIELKRLLRWRS